MQHTYVECLNCCRIFDAQWVKDFNGNPEDVQFCGPNCSINYYNRLSHSDEL